MMYSNKVVVAVKVNGQVLREDGDTVSLPFGSEYSILVKNLESVRSLIRITIDGEDAVGEIVIGPNSHAELERFIKNGNLQAGNCFKFVERIAAIEKHRGIGAEDGLIRIESWKEYIRQFVNVPIPRYYDDPHYQPPCPPRWPPAPRRPMYPVSRGPSPIRGGMPLRASLGKRSQMQARSAPRPAKADIGITVPGSESRQQFHTVSGFPLEPQSVVIVLRLRGTVGEIPIDTPVTVDMKPTCRTCGLTNKATSQFCSRCGTALQMIA